MIKKHVVELTSEEREYLEAIVSKGKKAPAYKIKHAHILLGVDARGPDLSDQDVARMFHCHRNTVFNVRQRFVAQGIEAALGRKKREHPPVEKLLDGKQEARLVALSCSKAPEGRAHWTLRMLADELVALEVVDSISHETVRQTLKRTNSQPAMIGMQGGRKERITWRTSQ